MGMGYHSILPEGVGLLGGCWEKGRRPRMRCDVRCDRCEEKYVRLHRQVEALPAVELANPALAMAAGDDAIATILNDFEASDAPFRKPMEKKCWLAQ
jgi:hypothetical protein